MRKSCVKESDTVHKTCAIKVTILEGANQIVLQTHLKP